MQFPKQLDLLHMTM